MVRALGLLFVLLCLAFAGCDVEIVSPVGTSADVSTPLAVVRGEGAVADDLTLTVTRGERALSIGVGPGTTLAFEIAAEGDPLPVRLPGLGEARTIEKTVTGIAQRFRQAGLPARLRADAGEGRLVVDVDPGCDDALATVMSAVTARRDVRFLLEVLPKEAYRPMWEGGVPPRLEKGPLPWNGSPAAFHEYKLAEVERWRAARKAGLSYAPSRLDLFVLPNAGSPAEAVGDFRVLAWPVRPEFRFDGRMLVDGHTAYSPDTGQKVVLCRIHADWQDAFHAWTEANVGLPLALVVDWAVKTAPIINSPLRDNVQITMGRGSYAQIEKDVEALARSLWGVSDALPAHLTAAVSRTAGGAFEVWVPLEEGETATVGLEMAGQGVERTLRRDSEAPIDVDALVSATIAEVRLGRWTDAVAAERLRASPSASVERLVALAANVEHSPLRRAAATRLLSRVAPSSPAVLAALTKGVRDAEPDVAHAAVAALAHLEPKAARGRALVAALPDVGPETKAVVIQTLAPLGQDVPDAFEAVLAIAAHGEEPARASATSALGTWASDAEDALLAAAEREDPAVRAVAVRALAYDFSSPRAAWLVAKAKDSSSDVRVAAVQLLWYRFPEEREALLANADALLALLKDDDERVRYGASATLGRLGEPVVPALLETLAAEEPDTRSAVLGALAALETPPATVREAVIAALADPDPKVRLTAAYTHVALGGAHEKVGAVVEDALGSEVSEVRQGAVMLLLAYGVKAPGAVKRLPALLEDPEEAMRVAVAAVLERQGVDDARAKAILDAVRSDPEHPQRHLLQLDR